MGFLSRLLGMDESPAPRPSRGQAPPAGDDRALERYRYMLQTAPPETIEQAHAEAFAQLAPEQRRQVLSELAQASPAHERAAIAATPVDDTRALGRVATRAEIRQPGFMERTLGGAGGAGLGGFGGGFLSSFAAGFVGSMVAQTFFSGLGGFGGDDASADAATGSLDDAPADTDDGNFGDDLGGGDGFDGGDMDL
jgi:hypothetical protein